MNHFIVSFQAIIDATHIEHGLIGSISPTKDYQPNMVKNTITEQYRKRFPNAKGVAVIIVDAKLISVVDYKKAISSFIQLIP